MYLPRGRWLEPGAGDGAIIRAVNSVRSDVDWLAYELREECRTDLVNLVGEDRVVIDDFLIPQGSGADIGRFDVALGNPPFRLAQEFLERCLAVADHVVLLLRLNYLGSEKRHQFMVDNLPDAFVIPNRISFDERGTDSVEYAWLAWGPNRSPRPHGNLRLLGLTPKEQRRRPKARKTEPESTGG